MKPYKPAALLKKEHNGVRRASFSMKDVFSSSMFSSKGKSLINSESFIMSHYAFLCITPENNWPY